MVAPIARTLPMVHSFVHHDPNRLSEILPVPPRCESLNDAVICDALIHIARNFSSGISPPYSPIRDSAKASGTAFLG